MVGAGVTYGMTGNATFNVASLGGTGFMELHLGKDGFGMNFGMGGTDVSFQTLSSAVSGYREADKVTDWKTGSEEQRSTLNGINMLGWTGAADNKQNLDVSKAIWNGELDVRYDDLATGNQGYYHSDNNPDEIVLSRALLGGGKESAAKLAAVMSHEGSHWSGINVEETAYKHGQTTYSQINAMFNLKSDDVFCQSMINAINAPKNKIANDPRARQDWMVMEDGSLIRDGRKSVYKQLENGEEFKILDYEYLENDVQSLASMMNLYSNGKPISPQEYSGLMMQKAVSIDGYDFQDAVTELNNYGKNLLNTKLAQNLIDSTGGILRGAGNLSDTTLGIHNAAFDVLTNYAKYSFSEETFSQIVTSINYEGLGVFLDLTQLKDVENYTKITNPSIRPESEVFKNTGLSGAGMYWTLGKINDTRAMGYSEKDVPDGFSNLGSKELWMRDALGATVNKRTELISKTGLNYEMLNQQRGYSAKQYRNSAYVSGFELLSELAVGASESMLNETKFSSWNCNGVSFFTVQQPRSYLNPGTSSLVNSQELMTSQSLQSMRRWYAMNDSFEKSAKKTWNNVIGWNSWASYKFEY